MNEDKTLSTLAAEERASLMDDTLPASRQRLGRDRITEVASELVTTAGPLIEEGARIFQPAHHQHLTERVRGLKRDALVVLAFALVVQNKPSIQPNSEFDALATELRTLDKTLQRWAAAWFADDPVEGPVFEVLRVGRGSRDDAEDVVGYCQMFLRNWDKVKTALPYTQEQIEAFERKATRFLGMVKVIEGADQDRLLLARAYARFESRFREVLAAAVYLASLKPGVVINLPGLSA